jgi:hypothetical protein
MYVQMWNNINRHLTVIWQSVGVLGGAIAVFALVEKNIVSVDFATAAVVVICFWLMANAYQTSGWFNRNQAIITNIEKEFLTPEDLSKIHPYFAAHRNPESMQGHIRVQFVLAAILAISVTVRHFAIQIWPSIGGLWPAFPFHKLVPYLLFVVGLIWVFVVRTDVVSGQRFFLQSSPGKAVQASPPAPAPPSVGSGNVSANAGQKP